MTWTNAADSSLFFSRQDPQDPRLGEWAERRHLQGLQDLQNLKTPSWILLGYPDDEGIALNGGRPGAHEAPALIRRFFYKMTPSLLNPKRQNLVDLGDLSKESSLGERHERGRQIIGACLKAGHRTLGLGGGHDYGYADGAGFIDYCLSENKRPLLINFDAHLDVRPSDKGFHSGTPFRRLLTEFEGQFDFVEVGLQNQCNSLAHFQWAQSKGAKTLLLQDLREVGLQASLEALLAPYKSQPCFLSIDIDAFTSNEAPGCSQSWTTGLHLQEFLPALRFLQTTFDVRSLAIYEVSPPLDQDHRTSKLAALILHHALFQA